MILDWKLLPLDTPDARFFLPPPPSPSLVQTLNVPKLFRIVLTSLPTDNNNECINYFTTTALENYVASADEDTVRTVDLEQEFSRLVYSSIVNILILRYRRLFM